MPQFKNEVIGEGEGPDNDSLDKRMAAVNKHANRPGGTVDMLRNFSRVAQGQAYPGMARETIGGKPISLTNPSRGGESGVGGSGGVAGLSGVDLSQRALDNFLKGLGSSTAMPRIRTEPITVYGEGDKVEMHRSPNNYLTSDNLNLPTNKKILKDILKGYQPPRELEAPPELGTAGGAPSMPKAPNVDMSKMAGSIPKTKSGMKKFMDEYGKFIAIGLGGAVAGRGGKKGMIAAPIIAALPGIMKMLQNRGKKTTGTPAGTTPTAPNVDKSSGYPEYDYMTKGAAHGGLLRNKSAAHPDKKMLGGAIRKFKGGSVNMMKDNLTPKYKKGGDMPKGMSQGMMAMMGKMGKATGDMPEHKKMDMGMPIGKMPDSKKMGMAKPKPSSMGQKFAKGGTAKYASGGMCKGYGISKKIRPTGVMN